jgi:hypothetical protein
MKYMVNSQENPHNYPLYSAHFDLDSFILYNDDDMGEQIAQLEEDTFDLNEDQEINKAKEKKLVISEELPADFWSMDFDGAVSKEGAREGVWLHNHKSRYS